MDSIVSIGLGAVIILQVWNIYVSYRPIFIEVQRTPPEDTSPEEQVPPAVTPEENKMARESLCGKMYSETALSCLYTAEVASAKDKRQAIPDKGYTIPKPEVRILRAQLILEEAVETIEALGLFVTVTSDSAPGNRVKLLLANSYEPVDMEEVIDGVCDTIYVCTGLLCAMGVPDLPHLKEVWVANNAKFPNGEAIVNADGKYMKPPGWEAPDHKAVQRCVTEATTVPASTVASLLVDDVKCGRKK